MHDLSSFGPYSWPLLKLSLYSHVKEFIQRQMNFGNIVKFAKYNPRYVYVYQKMEHKGRPPHLFTWDVLQRRVVRRMKAQSQQFSFDEFINKVKVETGNVINLLEISPFGTFMIAIVDNSLICKKYLPDGVLKQFKPVLKGCFYQECQIGPIEFA